MALTLEDFLVSFPEFRRVDGTLIEAKIAAATIEVDPNTWGKFTDLGVGYLAAHTLALSPMGNAAQLVGKTGQTVYEGHYMRLKRLCAAGIRST